VVTINGNGSVTYTPTPAFVGNDSVTYRLSDALNIAEIQTNQSTSVQCNRPVVRSQQAEPAENSFLGGFCCLTA